MMIRYTGCLRAARTESPASSAILRAGPDKAFLNRFMLLPRRFDPVSVPFQNTEPCIYPCTAQINGVMFLSTPSSIFP